MDPTRHRRLMHLTADVHLEQLGRRVSKDRVADINLWYDKDKDSGMTWYFNRLRADSTYPVYSVEKKKMEVECYNGQNCIR